MIESDGELPVDGVHSPFDWDGRSTYSRHGEPTSIYEIKCLLCGRVNGEELVYLTDRRAALIRKTGLPRCQVCGGWCQLEQIIGGSGHSPTTAAPKRTVAQPLRIKRSY